MRQNKTGRLSDGQIGGQIKNEIGIHRLRYKMTLLFSIFILIPVSLSGIYSYREQADIIQEDFEVYKSRLNQQAVKSIEDNIMNLKYQSLSVFANAGDVSELLTTPDDEIDFVYLDRLNSTKTYFLSILDSDSSIRGISLIDTNGVIKQYIGHGMEGLNLRSVKEEAWFQTTMQLGGKPYVIQPHYNSFEITGKSKQRAVISVARAVMDLDTFSVIGVLLIDQDISYLSQLLQAIETEQGERMLIYDEQGEVIYRNGSLLEEEEQKLYETLTQEPETVKTIFAGKPSLITCDNSNMLNWKIVSAVPMNTIRDKTAYVKQITLTSIAVLFVVILLVSTIISFFITRSLDRLSVSIRELEDGDFTTHVMVYGRDEVAYIGHAFNNMVRKLKILVDQTYKLELLNKQSEISVLQSQINPHFLFNTLNSLYAVAQREGNAYLGEMIYNLSDLFRYSIRKGNEFVTLEEEVQHLQKYAALQKLRYGERFTLQCDVSEKTKSARVPRLILQPIVENCIQHGFENTLKGGEIMIASQSFGDELILYVSDNGEGITEKEMKQMNSKLLKSEESCQSSGQHIGIYNVNARIKLHFGMKYGLEIYSTPESGFTVKYKLPMEGNGENGQYITHIHKNI